jgi:hypothetical protein
MLINDISFHQFLHDLNDLENHVTTFAKILDLLKNGCPTFT